ncbi:hypothetical protein NU10_07860 [Flavobacterium dauae]|uniref:hypothetical protein n=1 Tax=Flavobacterium dauae TaxID=1563479 RepID=UPI00101B5139|nr:hypothetical protein [Flavobacterium dauae]WLD22652.1 hypothetical protein NU10_07860 [Flavobacterium dauae]
MKIIIDKINSEPKHSLSKKELQLILSKIPINYVNTFVTFKISSQMFSNSGWDRPVIKNNETYNILSRGLDKKYIIKELLIEIFLNHTHINFYISAHKINSDRRKKLDDMVNPYFEEIIKDIEVN